MPLSKYDIEVDLANRPGTSHALLVELVGSNKRVLDVGCDTGYLGEALDALGNRTAGFEINEETARRARERLYRVEVGDLEAVDLVSVFGPAMFDVVVFGDVLEHLRNPLIPLRQARSLLAPGGSVIISTPNIAHGDIRLALLQGRFNYTSTGILDSTHTRFFTRDSLVEFLHDAGLVLVDLRRTIAPLFSTEVALRVEDFDSALVARLNQDLEATTYQFVVRGVPDDATVVTSQQALRVDELCERVRSQQRQIDTLIAERAESHRRISELELASAQADATRLERAKSERALHAPSVAAGRTPARSRGNRAQSFARRLKGAIRRHNILRRDYRTSQADARLNALAETERAART